MENEEFKWHGFAKFWLWLCFIVNSFAVLSYVLTLVTGTIGAGVGLLGLVASAVQVTGFVMLLFKKKKMGFYLAAAAAVLSIILNIIAGSAVSGILSAVISIGILYLVIKNSWDQLA